MFDVAPSVARTHMRPEDDVYLCSWRIEGGVWTVWWKKRPTIQATGATFDAANERLLEQLEEIAVTAVQEFDPPLPRSAVDAPFAEPALVTVAGDERFDPAGEFPQAAHAYGEERERGLSWMDGFFTAPLCRACLKSPGSRTTRPLPVGAMDSTDGGFGSIGCVGAMSFRIFSEQFLALLAPHELERLRFQPVERKGRRRFLELIGPDGPDFVGVREHEPKGWACRDCGAAAWGYWNKDSAINHFIARSDVPSDAEVFTIGRGHAIELAMTEARWRQLVGKPGTKKLLSLPLGVVPDDRLLRRPELPLR